MTKFYCLRCKNHIDTSIQSRGVASNGRPLVFGVCPRCGKPVSVFVSSKKAAGIFGRKGLFGQWGYQ
jgi:DNA-directed RNA polymerase subunit RPC12/RpoP